MGEDRCCMCAATDIHTLDIFNIPWCRRCWDRGYFDDDWED